MRFAVLVSLCCATPAIAVGPVRVVLLTRPGTLVETVIRLKAELKTAGFEVLEDSIQTEPEPSGLAELALTHQAAAVIALDRHGSDRGVRVWVEDRLTGKTLSRTIGAEAATPSLLALRAIDLLQASFLELKVRPPPEPLAAPVQGLLPVEHPEVPPQPARLQLGLGAGALGQRGFDVALAAAVSVRSRVAQRVWVGAAMLGPTLFGDFKGVVRAAIQQWMLWADLQLHFEPLPWLELRGGAGVGVVYLNARTFDGLGGSVWSTLLATEASATWWLTPHLGARASVIGVGALTPMRLFNLGQEIGRAAEPLIAGTLGVMVRL